MTKTLTMTGLAVATLLSWRLSCSVPWRHQGRSQLLVEIRRHPRLLRQARRYPLLHLCRAERLSVLLHHLLPCQTLQAHLLLRQWLLWEVLPLLRPCLAVHLLHHHLLLLAVLRHYQQQAAAVPLASWERFKPEELSRRRRQRTRAQLPSLAEFWSRLAELRLERESRPWPFFTLLREGFGFI